MSESNTRGLVGWMGRATVAVLVSLGFAGVASAQSAQGDRARAGNGDAGTASASRRGETTPGTFRESQAETTTDVSTGSVSANAAGPVGQVHGDDSHPEQIVGPIGPADVARIMQVQMPRLRPCYDRARETHANLVGRVEVRFTVARDGRVSQSTASGMPEAPEVATCVADLLRQTTFPQPSGGPLQFIYPLNFAPPPTAAPTHGRGSARSTGSASHGAARH